MFAVCIVFIVTTLPASLIFFMRLLSEFLEADFIVDRSTLLLITYELDDINHAVNFILYCLSGSVFRQTLVNMFQSCGQKNSQIEEPIPTLQTQL